MEAPVSEDLASTPTTIGPSNGFMITSIVASAVGAGLAVLTDLVGLAVAGVWAGRRPVMFNNEVLFRTPGSEAAAAGGVLLCLIVGGFLIMIYPSSRQHNAARIMVLWATLHTLGRAFLALGMGPFDDEGPVATAAVALDLDPALMWLAATIGGLGLVGLAIASAPGFLAYARRHAHIATRGRRVKFVARLGVLPGIAGPILAVPFFLPDVASSVATKLPTAGLFLLITLAGAAGSTSVRVQQSLPPRQFSPLPVVWYVVLILFAYFVLDRGLIIPPDLTSPFLES